MKTILVQLLLLSFATLCYSLPLSTSSRWIIDDPTGSRVKLICVNWAAHLEPMLAEGLDQKPVGDIVRDIADMGFNCVRLTWATYMFTRYANIRVAQSIRTLGLQDAVEGIARNNPGLLNLTVVDAHRAVIQELGRKGVMVVLDNHLSKPMWCCNDNDGNGFFGDKYFDPKEWLKGLNIVAKRYKDTSIVVGMSLRNELRGPLQNESVWYKYIEKGARTIHKANPKLLVIISGLNYDLSLSFLKEKPLKINFKNKLVYELHRYSFSAGGKEFWLNQPFNRVCERITQEIHRQGGFLIEGQNAAPLFASEFGINQVEMGRADRLFLGCYVGYLAEMDLDWSVWALQGSYYIKNGLHGFDETFGMLNTNWSFIRNPAFHLKLEFIQQQFQDPNSGSKYHLLYHPSSGRCIQVDNSEVHAGDCRSFSRWNHDGNGKPFRLKGTGLCLSAAGDGIPVTISEDCKSRKSQWELVSGELANKNEHGNYLCLQVGPNSSSRVLTRKCIQSPHTQWFKLIAANA